MLRCGVRAAAVVTLATVAAAQDCTVLGVVQVPGCPAAGCASLNEFSNIAVAGGAINATTPSVADACLYYDDCVVPYLGSPIVQGAMPGASAQQMCTPPPCVMTAFDGTFPDCPPTECTRLGSITAALLGGGTPAADDVQFVCSERERCLTPYLENPLVAGALGMSEDQFCGAFAPAYECSILGVVGLPECQRKGCEAATAVATEIVVQKLGPDTVSRRSVVGMCYFRDTCAAPLFAHPITQSLISETVIDYCGTPAPTREQPTNCTWPVGENGTAGGRCAAVQEVTGFQCCDDPNGELKEVGTMCEEFAADVTEHCYQQANQRLHNMYLCPVDNRNGTVFREVRDLCPRRCKNSKVPGCECDKSYDKGCPTLQCFVPDDDKYEWEPECKDCEVYGQILKCTEPDQTVRTVLIVVLIVVLSGIVIGLTVYVIKEIRQGLGVTNRRPSQQVRRRSTVKDMMSSGLRSMHEKRAADCIDSLWMVFERYRLAFERTCWRFGYFLSCHRTPFFCGVFCTFIILAVCGLPQGEIDKNPTSTDWAPSGGRLERQLEYWNKWISPASKTTFFYLMVGPDDGSNAINKTYLDYTHRILLDLLNVSVDVRTEDGGSMNVSFEDWCLRIPENPTFDALYPGEKPCISPGVLDCFFEGAWQIEDTTHHRWPEFVSEETKNLDKGVATLNDLFGATDPVVDTYRDRPSYMNLTQQQLMERLSEWPERHGGCWHWATGFSLEKLQAVGGGTENPPFECPPDPSIHRVYTHAKMLASSAVQASIESARLSRRRLEAATTDELQKARDRWEDAIKDRVEWWDENDRDFPNLRVSLIFSTFQQDVLAELANAQGLFILIGYLLMSVVIAWEWSCKSPINNLAVVAGIYYLFIMTTASAAAFGIIALMDLKYSHMMLQVLPYLAIGLGVDDMFLLLHYFRKVPDKSRPSHEIVADLIHGGGRSVTLTSATNLITFFGGAMVPIPALRNYLVLGGLIVVFNFVAAVVCLPLMLSFWVDRHRERAEKDAQLRQASGVEEQPGFADRVVRDSIAPFLGNRATQIVLVVLWVCLVVFSAVSLAEIAPITVDFQITDLAPRGTYLARSVSDFQDYFYGQTYDHRWYVQIGDGTNGPFGEGVDLSEPVVQENLQLTAYRLGLEPEINSTNPGERHWLFRFYEFVEKKNASLVVKQRASTGEDSRLACSKNCLAGNNNNETFCRSIGECKYYLAGHPWYVQKEYFYKYLHTWRHLVDGGADSLTAIALGSDQWGYKYGTNRYNPRPGCDIAGCNDTNILKMTYTSFTADARCVDSPSDWKGHTNRFRAIISDLLGGDAYPTPTDYYYDVELFDTTKEFFWNTLAIAVSGVFVSALVVPVSIKGAFIISLSGLAATLELTSLLMLSGISFTTTIAVSIIMAIGLSVDPVVHVVSAYEHCTDPGRQERLRHAILYSTAPILKSGMSTIISFCMMAASPFPYVVKYSFLPLLLSIIISMLHGALLVPAVLGLLGASVDAEPPPTFTQPHARGFDEARGSTEMTTVTPGDVPVQPLKEKESANGPCSLYLTESNPEKEDG
eukprot:TRINITY_DN1968_c0_g1_i2.p1 TRINITY_DN1968_c0_g1~~TRINITY_DN1968_c0_g1_i2.p1  ORF type:complete len:1552 (+),score=455.44 TRINITY_DN1968_c0_g1_i2:101-4756(+)